ncbi:hypothetical protein T492DRAFT_870275, partial [Pavlovales sp. CCMP2436]
MAPGRDKGPVESTAQDELAHELADENNTSPEEETPKVQQLEESGGSFIAPARRDKGGRDEP